MRRIIAASLNSGKAAIDDVAGRMAMTHCSVGSPMRRAQFSDLVDETRRELATQYLRDARITLTDAAFWWVTRTSQRFIEHFSVGSIRYRWSTSGSARFKGLVLQVGEDVVRHGLQNLFTEVVCCGHLGKIFSLRTGAAAYFARAVWIALVQRPHGDHGEPMQLGVVARHGNVHTAK